MTFSFLQAINGYVARRESVREPDGRWHPSSLYGCGRQVIYGLRGTPETNPRDDRSKRTLWLGSRIHEWVQEAVEEHPEVLEAYSEVHIDISDLNIVGDADVLYRTADGWELGEVKSIGAMALKFAKSGDLPKEDHKGQALTYMFGLRQYGSALKAGCKKHPLSDSIDLVRLPNGELSACPNIGPLGDELKTIRFGYFGKDALDPNEFFVTWTPAMEQEIRDKVEMLSGYANDPASLPPRLPFTGKKMDTKDWRCRYCPFMDLCWKKDPEQIDPAEDVW